MPGERRRTEYMPLTDVLRAPRNPKKHATQIIADSMARFGVVELPALDERTGRLVAGHGRLDDWLNRKNSGEDAPDGIDTDPATGDWLVPVSRGWASEDDAQAEAYLITSNNSVILGGWREDELEQMLADIAREDFGLAQITGASAADLDRILDALSDDTPTLPTQTPGEASWMVHVTQTRPDGEGDDVVEHDSVPATDARYGETAEAQEARTQQVGNWKPAASGGLTEMVLVYTNEDRQEAARLIAAARETLGADLKGSEVVLRALRTLVTVLDGRDDAEPVELSVIAAAAGWEPEG